MITEHIELPDPRAYCSERLHRYFDNQKYRVVAYTVVDHRGDNPVLLARVDTPNEADRIVKELRVRLDVARTLLGLK